MSLYLAEETVKIVGFAMEVHNTLGPGLNEKPYENALAIEFRLAGIPFKQQPPFPILYKGNVVDESISDLIAYASQVGTEQNGTVLRHVGLASRQSMTGETPVLRAEIALKTVPFGTEHQIQAPPTGMGTDRALIAPFDFDHG